jgi:DnaJ domain
MADAATAVRVAIDLIQMPSRARMIRQAPLPDGMPLLLRIAAMEPEATAEAAALTGRTSEVILNAAVFFVEQILLAPESDSYRVLGAAPQASSAELRHNMALLVRWLHPDVKQTSDRTAFVNRVTFAWDDLKTAERRAAYDAKLSLARSTRVEIQKTANKSRRSLATDQPQPRGLFQRAVLRLMTQLRSSPWKK